MTESDTTEREQPSPAGFVPAPFWVEPFSVQPEDQPAPPDRDRALEPAADDQAGPEDAADAADSADTPDAGDTADAADAADAEGPEEPEKTRFEELVEERLPHVRYAHPLIRAVFSPDEILLTELVERRAAVWVPTMTLLVTVVSALAAVVLATRLRTDPSDPSGGQFVVVTVTVCLVAAAFVTLMRSEMYYQRMRPSGRVVRYDIADAYETVRDAPRRLLEQGAPAMALRRVADLLPVAEQMLDVLALHQAQGGPRVKAHPAYEQITRMRAEVEALARLLEEQAAEEDTAAPPPARLQTPAFEGLADIAAALSTE